MANENGDQPEATVWSRTTPWRQGSSISPATAVKLGLIGEGDTDHVAIVISHDCDIASDDLETEPAIEVIVGQRIQEIHGNYSHAKNARTLHIEIDDPPLKLALSNTQKKPVLKRDIANEVPSVGLSNHQGNLRILRAWLAARYNRVAFPDTLVDRLRVVEDILIKEAKKTKNEIVGIFFDYDPRDQELAANELYTLSIIIVYSTEVQDAATVADTMVARLQKGFEKAFKNDKTWKGIELLSCAALSDSEFTLRDVFQTKQYRLEHISYRQEPPGPTADV